MIELIAEGLSNKETAQRLNIATYTVKSRAQYRGKTGVAHSPAGSQLCPSSRNLQTPIRINIPSVEIVADPYRLRRQRRLDGSSGLLSVGQEPTNGATITLSSPRGFDNRWSQYYIGNREVTYVDA